MISQPSTDIAEKKEKYVKKLRTIPEKLGKPKWYQQWGRKIEKLNKQITYPLVGKWYGIPYLKRKLHPNEIKSILFLRPDAIGDMIVSTPLWRILKNRNPDIEIGVAGSFRNIDVLRADTDVSHIHSYDLSDKKELSKEMAEVRKLNYGGVFLCKIDKKAYGAFLCARSTKTGYTFGLSTDHDVRHDRLFSLAPFMPHDIREGHMTDQLIYMLEHQFELGTVTEDEKQPSVIIDERVLAQTKRETDKLLSDLDATSFIVLNTQARNEFLEWGNQNSFKLAEMIVKEYPNTVVILTSSPQREHALRQDMEDYHLHKNILYFPTPDLHQMFSLIRLSKMVVTPDTSVIHMAAAERKPLVSFYPRKSQWAPYHIPSYMIHPVLDTPLSTISPGVAFDAVKDLMDPHSETIEKRILRIVKL